MDTIGFYRGLVLDEKKLQAAIRDAIEISGDTRMPMAVVERKDRCGDLLEYAVADETINCSDSEYVVWRMTDAVGFKRR